MPRMESSGGMGESAYTNVKADIHCSARGESPSLDKDSILRYSRAVRRLHDRRLAQATSKRSVSELRRRASWDVGLELTSTCKSPWTGQSPSLTPSQSFSEYSTRYSESSPVNNIDTASEQNVFAPLSESQSSDAKIRHQQRRSSGSWTPLGRRERFASFWNLPSEGTVLDHLRHSSSISNLRETSNATESASPRCAQPWHHIRQSSAPMALAARRRTSSSAGFTHSSLSLDLESGQNVSHAINWVRDQMQEIHTANQQLAHQMSTLLGSVKSLRKELEDEEDEQQDDDVSIDTYDDAFEHTDDISIRSDSTF